ncbi:MAG: TatD family hydrolase [Erysipelotrichia bacterium]|nr:TatD family hydrolase [Erysipelotrichia bacterium]
MSYWIDSHCHMNDKIFYDDFDGYMQRAQENNVLVSNLVCLNKQDLQLSYLLKEKYPRLDISFGYFPEDCLKVSAEDLNYLEKIISEDKRVKFLGEIGLDYHYGKENKEKQIELFIRQIEIANKYNKTIMIHTRDASEDTYNILEKYAKTKVLMHCFSESTEMLRRYLKLGYFISFSGVITFKNAQTPKENVLQCPLDRILTETDCPYLTPVPFRGKTNETSFVRYTGEYMAQLKGVNVEQLQQQIIENYAYLTDVD